MGPVFKVRVGKLQALFVRCVKWGSWISLVVMMVCCTHSIQLLSQLLANSVALSIYILSRKSKWEAVVVTRPLFSC